MGAFFAATLGKVNLERCALSQVAVHLYGAAKLGDYAGADRKAQACACFLAFGGEERLEQPCHHFIRNSCSVVRHRQERVFSRFQARIAA
jgi:hypothetical protein